MAYDYNIDKVSKLERKLAVTLSEDEMQKERAERLKKLAPRVKLDGFRPGKVPLSVVEKKYGDAVIYEVLEDQLRKSYAEILEKEDLHPVAAPKIDMPPYQEGQPIKYTAVFEIFPEIKLVDLDKIKVEKPVAEVTDKDIEDAITKLRRQYATYAEVESPIKKDDRVVVDIRGEVKGKEMPELTRKDFMFVMGDGLMREDFEENLYKKKVGDDLKFKIKYPKDYGEEHLAGAKVEYFVQIRKVEEATLPQIDDEFCKKMGIAEGGEAKLREEIKNNMQQHLDEKLQQKFQDNLLNALLDKHKVELPNALLEKEIKRLNEKQEKYKQQMLEYAEKAGQDISKLPGMLSAEKIKEAAERNVGLGLLLQELVRMLDLKPDSEKVRKRIESLAAAYDNRAEAVDWYYKNKQLRNYVESQVLEEQVLEDMQGKVKVDEKKLSYKEAVE